MAELFDYSSDNISWHLKNIYKEEELPEETTAGIFSVVQKKGNQNVNGLIQRFTGTVIHAFVFYSLHSILPYILL